MRDNWTEIPDRPMWRGDYVTGRFCQQFCDRTGASGAGYASTHLIILNNLCYVYQLVSVNTLVLPLVSGINDKDYRISYDIQCIQKEDWFLTTNHA